MDLNKTNIVNIVNADGLYEICNLSDEIDIDVEP